MYEPLHTCKLNQENKQSQTFLTKLLYIFLTTNILRNIGGKVLNKMFGKINIEQIMP